MDGAERAAGNTLRVMESMHFKAGQSENGGATLAVDFAKAFE